MKKIGSTLSILVLVSCAHQPPAADDSTVKTGFAPVNGINLYYEIHGPSRKDVRPLVLLHGGSSTIESNYANFIPLLTRTRQVIAMEEAGHGHTKMTSRPLTFENSADDVAALLGYLQISDADIFGFSNGGTVALQVAIRHPERVHRLIVASGLSRRDGMVKGFFEGMKNATIKQMPTSLLDADRKINLDPKHQQELFTIDSQRMVGFQDIPEGKIRSIHAPSLIISGDQDVVLPEHSFRMAHEIPGARVTILPSVHGGYVGAIETGPVNPGLLEITYRLVTNFLDSKPGDSMK
jgi:pimeloyl-ACP methyl ester carboxylesterase